MKSRADSIPVILCFIAVICVFSVGTLGRPDRQNIEASEFSFKELLSGDYFRKLEEAYNERFFISDLRERFKNSFSYNVLGIMDIEGFYTVGGSIVKMEHRLYESAVINMAEKLEDIYGRYLRGRDAYYCVIPDKNLVVAADTGHLSFSYDHIVGILEKEISNIKKIEIKDLLELCDYYNTDPHWRQEKIIDVSDRILTEMDNSQKASDLDYETNIIYPFYGSHYSAAWSGIEPDSLVYLTSEITENAVVSDHEAGLLTGVYEPDTFKGDNPGYMYDMFLSGSKPIVTVTNDMNKNAKELILFRDSFGSSIAPLLLAGYSKITLVDLRYISAELLGDYIDFSRGQDVCFLYSTLVINSSYMLK